MTHLEAQACANLDAERAKVEALRDAAEKVSAAWDAWMTDEEGEGQDAATDAIGELRAALRVHR